MDIFLQIWKLGGIWNTLYLLNHMETSNQKIAWQDLTRRQNKKKIERLMDGSKDWMLSSGSLSQGKGYDIHMEYVSTLLIYQSLISSYNIRKLLKKLKSNIITFTNLCENLNQGS